MPHPIAITDEQRRTIVAMLEAGDTYQSIANYLQVCTDTAKRIMHHSVNPPPKKLRIVEETLTGEERVAAPTMSRMVGLARSLAHTGATPLK